MSDCDVKIVKSCSQVLFNDKSEAGKKSEEILSRRMFKSDENFLENVDEDVLFVDDSIDFKVKSFDAFQDEVRSLDLNQSPRNNQEKSSNFNHSPPLSAQVPLPIREINSLLFDEILMISKVKDPKTSNLIPNPNEIDETGSICVMAEKLDGEKILVYCATQLLDGDVNISHDVLSVVDENLKLVHEKIVEKTCVGRKIIVS